MRIGRWSEPRFVCQLVEVIREADDNETSGEDGLALPGSLVGESQLRILKFEPETTFSNRAPLVSVELEYHAESSSDDPGKGSNLLCRSLPGVCRRW